MKTPYDKLAKIYTICFDHMTKMAITFIYGKCFKNLLLQNQKTDDRGTWCVTLGIRPYRDDDPRLTLTYFTTTNNLNLNAFLSKKS